MWHFADLRFADPIFLRFENLLFMDLRFSDQSFFADLKILQVRKHILFLHTNIQEYIMFLFQFVQNKKKCFKKTTFSTFIRQSCAVLCQKLQICDLLICGFAICGLAHLRNEWICDRGKSPRSCRFAEFACPPLPIWKMLFFCFPTT